MLLVVAAVDGGISDNDGGCVVAAAGDTGGNLVGFSVGQRKRLSGPSSISSSFSLSLLVR